MKWFTDILTDDAGNFTPDKVSLVGGVLVYNGLAIYDVVAHKAAFIANATNYGLGLGAVLGLGGGAMWLASRQKSAGTP